MSLFATRSTWQRHERLATEARRAVQRAEAAGAERGLRQVPPDVLLLALLEESGGVPARALAAAGIPVQDVRDAAAGTPAPLATALPGRSPLDAAAREAVILGVNEARRAGFKQAGAGHVLLGVLEARSGAGARLLVRRGLGPRTLRALVHELEQHNGAGGALFAAAFPALLSQIGGARACPRCEVALHASFRYCYNCGTPLAGDAEP